ncbi:hypothetical protein [Paraclostridium dentum]|uniref:hypothetical protein n=1 Tax=Paraclostridium dentum TaxID=2662455 RepID=UPI003F2BA16A
MKTNEGIRNITNRMELVQSLRTKLVKTRLILIAVTTLLTMSAVSNVMMYNKVKNTEATVVTKEVVVKDIQEVKPEINKVDAWVQKQLDRDTVDGQATSMTYANDILDAKDLNKQYTIGNTGWTRMFNYGEQYAVVVDYKISGCAVNYIVYIMDVNTFVSGQISNQDLLLNQYISTNMDYVKRSMCMEYNCDCCDKNDHDVLLNDTDIDHIVSR